MIVVVDGGRDDEALRAAVVAGSRAFVGIAARSLAEVADEVTLAQYRVLVLLDEWGTMAMSGLADRLGVNPSTVTRVCDALVDKGLIARGANEADRRTVHAALAPPGRALVDQVLARRAQLIGEALARMPAPARTQLARRLGEFAEACGEVSDHAWALGWSAEDVAARRPPPRRIRRGAAEAPP